MRKNIVVKHFGKQIEIARALGISKGSVSQWGEVIPEKQALRLDRLTDGQLRFDPTMYEKNNTHQLKPNTA